MSPQIFEFTDYKAYLKARLTGKGGKSAFAKALGCQPSFLSQVLCGTPNLSLEQGVSANDNLAHSPLEARYFLALLQLERAGSVRLRQHFQMEIRAILSEHRKVAERLTANRELTPAARAIYYSSWVYGAVHVLASISVANQMEFLLQRTGLVHDELDKVLTFLIEHGLLRQSGGQITPAEGRIHLPGTDPLVLNHHRNLRARALQEMQVPKNENLHYSLLMAISKDDGLRIRDMILKLVENTDKIIKPSKEESAFQLNLDFFEI